MARLDELIGKSRTAELSAASWAAVLERTARDMRVEQCGGELPALYRNAKQTFARTLHGYATASSVVKATNDARALELVGVALEELAATPLTVDEAFDAWHQRVCASLCETWEGPCGLTVGQAQKLINVLFKSLLALADSRLGPAMARWTHQLHVPLDNQTRALLAELDRAASPPHRPRVFVSNWASISWSRIADYQREYMPLQQALRRWARDHQVAPITLDLVGWRPGE